MQFCHSKISGSTLEAMAPVSCVSVDDQSMVYLVGIASAESTSNGLVRLCVMIRICFLFDPVSFAPKIFNVFILSLNQRQKG